MKQTMHCADPLTHRPAIQPLKLEDFESALKSDDAFFLYLHNFDTEVADVVSCSVTDDSSLTARNA